MDTLLIILACISLFALVTALSFLAFVYVPFKCAEAISDDITKSIKRRRKQREDASH